MNTESVTSETSGAAEQTTPKRKRAGKGKPAKQAAKAKTGTKKACKVAGSTSKSREGSKTAMVLELLRRKDGATIGEIAKATNWQNHSIRGFISGTVSKNTPAIPDVTFSSTTCAVTG